MRDIVKEYQEKFRQNRKRARRYTALLLALALTTSLFVNWQLHGVGIAKTADYLCGQEEHEHTAACYPTKLVCGYEEGQPEDRSASGADYDAAFGVDADGNSDPAGYSYDVPAVSDEPEFLYVPHEHTDDCYQEVPVLTCLEEEHEHTDDCFDPEDNSLLCEQFEHTHDDSCYTTEYELVCGLEEGELVEQPNPDYAAPDDTAFAVFSGPVSMLPVVTEDADSAADVPLHHHTSDCYAPDYDADPICGLEEHHHTVNCLSDPMDGVEDEDDWLSRSGVTLGGIWNEDLLAVAQAELQSGYEQSERNFEIDPGDGTTVRYYTRYGAWYGIPYGSWDVTFLSYCLKHASIDSGFIPQCSGVLALRADLKKNPLSTEYAGNFSGDLPIDAVMPGDIVIYNGITTKAILVESDSAADTAAGSDAGIAVLPLETGLQVQTALPDAAAEPEAEENSIGAEPEIQEQTVADETVGIVSRVDEASGTLTVISGNVDGKVAEVTLSAADVTTLISVAGAQAASAASGADTMDSSETVEPDLSTMLDGTPYVTDFKIQKKNSHGQAEDADTVLTTDTVYGYLDLSSIPAQKIIDHDYQLRIDLPAGFDCSEVTGTLADNNGTYSFVKNGDHWTIVLKYSEEFIRQEAVSEASTVDSWVRFNFQWDETVINKNGKNDFRIDDSHTVTVTINEKKDDSKKDRFSVEKSDSKLRYVGDDAFIDYTVTLVVKEDLDAPLSFTDTLTSSGGASFNYTADSPEISSTNSTSVPEITWQDGTGTSKTITLGKAGEMIQKGTYKITYHVKCSDLKNAKLTQDAAVKNKISTSYEDEKAHEASTETKLSNSLIDKSGKLKDGFITWTVTLNAPNGDGYQAYLPADAVFTDELPGDLVNGKITVSIDGEKGKEITLTDAQYDPETRKITYPLGEGRHTYKITYKTKAPENTGVTDITVKNTGHLGGTGLDSSKTADVTISSDLLSKKLDRTETTDDVLTLYWTTTIDATDLSSYCYYDWSGIQHDKDSKIRKTQEIVPGSVKVWQTDGTDVTEKVAIDYSYQRTAQVPSAVDDYGTDLGLFSVDFTNSGVTGPVTITYQTKTDLSKFNRGRLTIYNYGQLNDGKTVQDVYDFQNTENQRSYIFKYAGVYDNSSSLNNKGSTSLQPGEALPWTIVLNDDGKLTGHYDQWVVTDTIPDGLLLDEDSIKVSYYENPPFTLGTDYTYTVQKSTTAEGKPCTILTVTLYSSCIMGNNGDPLKHIVVSYNTYLDTESDALLGNDSIDFTNHASFTCDNEKKGDTEFTETVTRDIVGKHGTFDEATGTLTYNVLVNPYGVKLLPEDNGELLLKDVLNLPQQLYGNKEEKKKYVWLEGITVYEGGFENGEYVPTTLLRELTPIQGKPTDDELDKVSNSYVSTDTYCAKDDSGYQQIKVWTKVPDATPLVLVFHYSVDTRQVTQNETLDFKNTVTLLNNEEWTYTDQDLHHTVETAGGASVNYNTDRLTIYKYTGNQNHPLAGAEFELQRYAENGGWQTVNSSIKTNSSGNYTLNVARDTLYRIKETRAPVGYMLPDDNGWYYFCVTRSDSYTPPADAGAKDVRLYKVTTGNANTFQTFFYPVANAKNPYYITPGSLKVTKVWQENSGNDITDDTKLNALKPVTVILTKHAQKATVTFVGGNDSSTYICDVGSGQSVRIRDSGWNVSAFSLAESSVGKAGIRKDGTDVVIDGITGDIAVTVAGCSNLSGWFAPSVSAEGTDTGAGFDTEIARVELSRSNHWTHTWDGLDTGNADNAITYRISELSAEGYETSYQVNGGELTSTVPTLSLSAEGANVKVINRSTKADVYELPSTGGAGTTLYTAGGIALMLTALVCGLCQKRRRERRTHN